MADHPDALMGEPGALGGHVREVVWHSDDMVRGGAVDVAPGRLVGGELAVRAARRGQHDDQDDQQPHSHRLSVPMPSSRRTMFRPVSVSAFSARRLSVSSRSAWMISTRCLGVATTWWAWLRHSQAITI